VQVLVSVSNQIHEDVFRFPSFEVSD